MSEKHDISSLKDLSKKGVKRVSSFEELITRSLDNNSLNKYEGREILKRWKKDKDGLSEQTKNKLLEIAQKGGWKGLVRKIESQSQSSNHISSAEVNPDMPLQTYDVNVPGKEDLPSKQSLSESLQLQMSQALSESKKTQATKRNLDYMSGAIRAQKSELEKAQKWNHFSFLNTENKKIAGEIYTQILGVLESLQSQYDLSALDVRNAIETELSTSEGGVLYQKKRKEILDEILSTFFLRDIFVFDIRQKSVQMMRQNLASDEIKNIFEKELGAYKKGMSVPENKKWLLQAYEETFDPNNDWTKISDETINTITGVAVYDGITSILGGAVIAGGTKVFKGARYAYKAGKTIQQEQKIIKPIEQGIQAQAKAPASIVSNSATSSAKETIVKSEIKASSQSVLPKSPSKPVVPKNPEPLFPRISSTSISQENYLADLFADVVPTVSRGLNKTIMMRNGAKGNIQMFFKRLPGGADEIQKVELLVHGESFKVIFQNGQVAKAAGKLADKKLPEYIYQLVEKYKTML